MISITNISSESRALTLPKEETTFSENHDGTGRCSPKEICSSASNSKGLKLFPIFNLSATKIVTTDISVVKESDDNKPIYQNKKRKRAVSKSVDGILPTNSPPKSKRGRKRHNIADVTSVTASPDKKSTISNEHVNPSNVISLAVNEISHTEVEAPITKTLVDCIDESVIKVQSVEGNVNEKESLSEGCKDSVSNLNKINVQNEAEACESAALSGAGNEISDNTKPLHKKQRHEHLCHSVERSTNEKNILSEGCLESALTLNQNEAEMGKSTTLPRSVKKISDSTKPVHLKQKVASLFKSHSDGEHNNEKEILSEGCVDSALTLNRDKAEICKSTAVPTSVNKTPESRYLFRQNKGQKSAGLNAITANGNFPKKVLHTHSKRGRKGRKIVIEEPLHYNDCINPLSDDFVTGDDLSTTKVEVAITEMVEDSCTENQRDVQDSRMPENYVDKLLIRNTSPEVDINAGKSLSKGCTGSIVKLNLTEKFETEAEVIKAMTKIESPDKTSKNNKPTRQSKRGKHAASEVITLDDNLPMKLPPKKSKRGRKTHKTKNDEKSLNFNTNICPLSSSFVANDQLPIVEVEITEKVRDLCSEFQQDVCHNSSSKNCAGEILLRTHPGKIYINKENLSQGSVGRGRKGFSLSRRTNKKSVQNEIETEESMDILLPEGKGVETVTSRRQSLRSRGGRDNFVNYSELTPSKSVKKHMHKSEMQNECEILSNGSDSIDQGDKEVVPIDILHQTKTRKNKRISKNVKVNLKLFPIFSPNLNSLGKQKTKDIEVCIGLDMENNTTEIDPLSKKTKTYLNSNTPGCDFALNDSFVDSLRTSSGTKNNKNQSSVIIISDTENSDGSDIIVVEDPTLKESSNEKCPPQGNEKLASKVRYKHALSDEDVICFPIFSHVRVCDTTFSDISNRFIINEEIADRIILPVWKDCMGLIDDQSTRMIKSSDHPFLEMNNIQIPKKVVTNEDMLWTDSAQKLVLRDKSNEDTVSEIKSWLLLWKNKFSYYSKKGTGTEDSYSSDSDEDFISNAIIISGGPGSGKTSLVFSLADELGFTVLEVNASSCRNGRNISHQLKEALESYHVESVKVDSSNVGNVFDNVVKEKKIDKGQEIDSTGFLNKTRGIKTFFEVKNSTSPKKDSKPPKGGKNIASFFQSTSKTVEKQDVKYKKKASSKNEEESESDKSKNNAETVNLSCQKSSCKISSSTIILFDDVDVVFEEDEGFWSTVKGFLKISKKPVIFTVGRNLAVVKSILNADIRIFNMAPASKEGVVKRLKEYCREHSRENSGVDLQLLTSHNLCDIRRNILNAQFWTQMTGTLEMSQCKIDDSSSFNPLYITKPVHVNSFITGSVQFSTNHIRKLLFESLPCSFSNAIFQYQSLGYDILFNNIFNILYDMRSLNTEKLWTKLTVKLQECSSNVQNFSDSEMWKEACELFEKKKKALRNGSSSHELQVLADAMDDFSFADTLKGLSCNTFQWVPVSERLKLWTAGLPMCSEQNLGMFVALDIISLIHIYRLRKLKVAASLKYSDSSDDMQLDLQHPFFSFDHSFTFKTEDDLECISSVLPASQILNKTALNLDYLSSIKIICQNEDTRQVYSGKRSGRFLHYFDSISFYMDRKFF